MCFDNMKINVWDLLSASKHLPHVSAATFDMERDKCSTIYILVTSSHEHVAWTVDRHLFSHWLTHILGNYFLNGFCLKLNSP